MVIDDDVHYLSSKEFTFHTNLFHIMYIIILILMHSRREKERSHSLWAHDPSGRSSIFLVVLDSII